MSISTWDKDQRDNYVKLLTSMASISKIFSDNAIPYIDYRSHEKIFCLSFEAIDRGRDDSSVDATIGKVGVGLKTFQFKNGSPIEKVAEFNSMSLELNKLPAKQIVKKLVELRNLRISSTIVRYGLKNCFYHCLVRKEKNLSIYEFAMREIEDVKEDSIVENKNVITFRDAHNYYSYNKSKSTLYMKFDCKKELLSFDSVILDNPFSVFNHKLTTTKVAMIKNLKKVGIDYIYLPLYSTQKNNYGEPMPSSGLNQWNAKGRARNPDEVYIPVPALIHNACSGFFVRDTKKVFKLYLPNGEVLKASLCQAGEKGLMSNPNSALGKWILRDIFKMRKGQLIKSVDFDREGIDSVYVEKCADGYRIDFAKTGCYESFKEQIS